MSERLGNIDDHIYEMDELEEEIAITKRNNLENIEIKNKLLSALNINKTQKNILFELMFKMTDDNKAILLEKDVINYFYSIKCFKCFLSDFIQKKTIRKYRYITSK